MIEGMTFPTGPRRYAPEHPDTDPLTDSGVHRLMLGTRVQLHMYRAEPVEVSLSAIRDVTTWNDLVSRIANGLTIEVMASRRRVFAGGVVLWAEVTSDPIETPTQQSSPHP
jgi:hypothetical protein